MLRVTYSPSVVGPSPVSITTLLALSNTSYGCTNEQNRRPGRLRSPIGEGGRESDHGTVHRDPDDLAGRAGRGPPSPPRTSERAGGVHPWLRRFAGPDPHCLRPVSIARRLDRGRLRRRRQ